MKIAFFHDLPAGGALTATFEIAKKLNEDHTVDIFQLTRKRPAHYKPENHFNKVFNYSPRVPQNRILKDIYSLTQANSIQKQIAKQIDQKDYDIAIITHTRFFQAPWILRHLKTKTLFLCQEPTRAFFEKFLSIDSNLPLPNKLYEKSIRFIKKRIEIKNASFSNKTIANSKFSAKKIEKAYGKKAFPIHLGVNLQNFYPNNEKKQNQALVVGNNEPQKNLKLAVKAIACVKKSKRPILVNIGPRKSKTSTLKNLAKKNNVKLKIYNNISISKLRSLYNQSNITLAVSKNEPFGLSVIESMACQTPVIAIDQGGFKETIINGKTGYLVKPSAKEIGEKITLLQKDKNKQAEMGREGEKFVKKHYNWEVTKKELESLINSF